MKKHISRILVVAAFLTSTFAVEAGTITVTGSDTMVVLAQKWAEVYTGQHPDVTIQVNGGGSGTGFAAMQNRSADLCNASRPIKNNEKQNCVRAFKTLPTEYKVAMDGVAIYVHEQNSVKELTLAQLRDIYMGKIKNWKEVGGNDLAITLYSRENNSGTYEFLKDHVLEGSDFAASAQTMSGTASVLAAVANDPKGIGYGGIAYGAGAKRLNVKKDAESVAVEPTKENVQSGVYPISRYLFIYVAPALDKGEIANYLKWIRSADGQKVVEQAGYFPLPAEGKKED